MKAKRIISIVLCLLLISTATTFLSACGGETPLSAKFDLANTSVKDLAEYTSIGVGYEIDGTIRASADVRTSNGLVSASGQTNSTNRKLVGFRADNSCAEIMFEDQQGNSINQDYSVCEVLTLGRYMFVTYTNIEDPWFMWQSSYMYIYSNHPDYVTYLIDLKTQLVYATDFLPSKIQSEYATYNDDVLYMCHNDNVGYTISKLSIEGERLKVEEIIDTSLLNFSVSGIMTDKFSNLYLSRGAEPRALTDGSYLYNYVITNDKRLKTLPENSHLVRAINNQVYNLRTNQKFDEQGELVSSTDQCSLYNSPLAPQLTMAYSSNDSEYYIKTENSYDNKKIFTSYRVSWLDETNCDVEEVGRVEVDYDSMIISEDRLYYLTSNAIFYYDIKTMQRTQIDSRYVFRSFKMGYNGTILFTALNEDMNTVNGVIDREGHVSVEVKVNNFEILYVEPIKF